MMSREVWLENGLVGEEVREVRVRKCNAVLYSKERNQRSEIKGAKGKK